MKPKTVGKAKIAITGGHGGSMGYVCRGSMRKRPHQIQRAETMAGPFAVFGLNAEISIFVPNVPHRLVEPEIF